MPEGPQTVLVVEDGMHMGAMICQFLCDLGFPVVWVSKVIEFDADRATVIALERQTTPPTPSRVVIQWRDYPIALVDGLLGNFSHVGYHGWDIMPHLKLAGSDVIAISNDQHDNAIMCGERYGARFGTHHKQLRPDDFKNDIRSFLTQLNMLSP